MTEYETRMAEQETTMAEHERRITFSERRAENAQSTSQLPELGGISEFMAPDTSMIVPITAEEHLEFLNSDSSSGFASQEKLADTNSESLGGGELAHKLRQLVDELGELRGRMDMGEKEIEKIDNTIAEILEANEAKMNTMIS